MSVHLKGRGYNITSKNKSSIERITVQVYGALGIVDNETMHVLVRCAVWIHVQFQFLHT